MKRQFIAAGVGACALVLFALISAALATPVSIPALDTEPDNDDFGGADVIVVPGYATGVVSETDLLDHYVMTTEIGHQYEATLSILYSTGGMNMLMNLYNASQDSLGTDEDTLEWTAYTTTHYIRIDALLATTTTIQTGYYRLDVARLAPTPTPTRTPFPTATPTPTPTPTPIPFPTATPTPIHRREEDEPNDELDQANLVLVPSSVIGAIVRPPEDRECFVMHTVAGSWYTASLTIESPEGMELRVDLYDGNETYVKSSPTSSVNTSLIWAATTPYHYVCIEAPTNASALQSTFYRLDLWMDAFEASQSVYLPVILREAWIGNRARRS
jgi:hypothetical protein